MKANRLLAAAAVIVFGVGILFSFLESNGTYVLLGTLFLLGSMYLLGMEKVKNA